MRSIPESGREANSLGFAQRTLYPEDSHGQGLGLGAGGYSLSQALNADPSELLDVNEGSALQRILNRDTAEPLFPTGSRHGTSNIIREMRDERLRRANPAIQSNLNRGLFPNR